MERNSSECKTEAFTFLDLLFRGCPSESFLLVWTKDQEEMRSTWFPATQIERAATFASEQRCDTYFGAALSPKNFGPKRRCPAEKAAGVLGVWADVDIRGEAHKEKALPETREQSDELANSLGISPTVLVDSGHGLQPWWLFNEPWIFADDDERDRGRQLVEQFQAALRKSATAAGWELDPTHDLARVMRLPGTTNCKIAGHPVPVRILDAYGPRYDRNTIAALVAPPSGVFKLKAGCGVAERARRYVSTMPEAISGKNGHGAAFNVAQVLVRGFSLSIDESRPIMIEFSKRCDPEWSDKEIEHKLKSADQKSRRPRGYLLDKPSTNGHHRTNSKEAHDHKAPGPATFTVGDLALHPGAPRQTASGKITVPVTVQKDGTLLYQFVLTNAASGRKEPARLLRQFLGDDSAHGRIDDELTKIIAHAAGVLANKASQTEAKGPAVREIIADKVPQALQLVCRTPRGLWSETRGSDIGRSDFVTFVPGWLVDECGKASDIARDDQGAVVRPDLIRQIQMEMAVCWSDLLATLPTEANVELGKDTEKGRAFRQAMVRLWTRTQTFEIVKAQEAKGGEIASRASLISRVRTQARDYLGNTPCHPNPREKWRPVQHAFDSWWRPWQNEEGEVFILLGMRWTLMQQAGVELPGVTDQTTLTVQGMKFGVGQEPPPDVGTVMNRGKTRLFVLSLDLSQELIEQPMDDEIKPREPGEDG
jgi:hypothetical protein